MAFAAAWPHARMAQQPVLRGRGKSSRWGEEAEAQVWWSAAYHSVFGFGGGSASAVSKGRYTAPKRPHRAGSLQIGVRLYAFLQMVQI